jgi:hypothetical protein
VDGRALMAELDLKFAPIGGLKPIMKVFFSRYKNKIMTNEEFWSFLEIQTKLDVDPFNLYYAMSEAEETPDEPTDPDEETKHPTPLTEEEVLRLR